jgi:glycosyltransferase involved in cell wall biosynthesis
MAESNKPLTFQPLVSVVTPVYNGGDHLAECIESVLAQSYENWEYVIVNNRSTDNTLAIARRYEQKDNRIRIHDNDDFLPIMENWNHALLQMSPNSKYCKVVHADDCLFPQCVEQMVSVAEAHPSTGLVGSYGLRGTRIVGQGLPYPSEFVPGQKLGRLVLLGRINPFSRPTSLLIRSDLIRQRESFYDERYLHADVAACYETLRDSDFGFIHQVLFFVREHEQSLTSSNVRSFNKFIYNNLDLLIKYGPIFLTPEEYAKRYKEQISQYYHFLARSIFELREREFWRFHKDALQQLIKKFNVSRLIFTAFIELIGHSRTAGYLFKRALKTKFRDISDSA